MTPGKIRARATLRRQSRILAKGFGQGPAERKEVAAMSAGAGLLSENQTALMVQIAGYRNRLVQFVRTSWPMFTRCSIPCCSGSAGILI